MEYKLNLGNLNKLFQTAQDDSELLLLFYQALESFSDYHEAIFKAESWKKVYSPKSMTINEYQENLMAMDRQRTICHNAVLSHMNILNRIAEKNNIPKIYDGTISEEQPYRRQVADAVLEYVESIILERA